MLRQWRGVTDVRRSDGMSESPLGGGVRQGGWGFGAASPLTPTASVSAPAFPFPKHEKTPLMAGFFLGC